jgi:type IV pilus assembly protein PilV
MHLDDWKSADFRQRRNVMQLNGYSRARVGGVALARQAGASLLEVLIAILLLSFGMLALAGMQAFAVSANHAVSARGLAVAMANDYADMMRSNAVAFAAGGYDRAASFDATATSVTAVAVASTCAYPNCTATTLAAYEVAMMQARLKANLLAGTFALVRPLVGGAPSMNQADLWIMWTERRNSGNASDEGSFDKCPAAIVSGTTAAARCLYVRVVL